jgi:hypothetical protein
MSVFQAWGYYRYILKGFYGSHSIRWPD